MSLKLYSRIQRPPPRESESFSGNDRNVRCAAVISERSWT